MLRRNVDRIGYRPGFSIYDDGDSRRLVEELLAAIAVETGGGGNEERLRRMAESGEGRGEDPG